MTSCSHYPESPSPLQLSFASPALISSASPSSGNSASTLASTTMPTTTPTPSTLSPVPMLRPSSHSFSMERPPLPQDVKKTRNSKRLSLMVTPSPDKLEQLASIAAAATVAASSPSFVPPTPSFPPSTPSFSSRRHFTSAPLSSLATIQSQSPATSPAATPTTAAPAEEKRHSQLMLDQALPSPRFPLSSSSNVNAPRQRPISAYFADFSAECGTASPYTKEPVCVLPHLYLGAEHNATDVNNLARLGITAVLNVAIEISSASQQQYQVPASPTFQASSSEKMITVIDGDRIVRTPQGGSIHYKNLSWTHHQRNLLSEFPKAFAFIEDVKNMDGKVLVHCQLGVSRSASLVIAYVMKTMQMKLTDAYEFVKARSSVISPNMSLMYQLAEFGKSLERPLNSASSPRTPSRRDDYDDNNDDLEDGYPYPTDRMDLDGDVTMSAVKPTSPTIPVRTTTTKRVTLTLARPNSSSDQASSTLSRPRLTVNRSPLAPMNLNASGPKTPMTDRFVDAMIPSTPMTDRFSIPNPEPAAALALPVHPLSMLPQSQEPRQQFPEGVSMPSDLSPPVPPFLASHRVSSSSSNSSSSFGSSSGSSFTTNTTYSRPSSVSSSASSAALKMSVQPASAVVTPMPIMTLEEGKETRSDQQHWSKMPATPSRTHSGMSVSSASSCTSQKKKSKKAAIHALAKVLTRPWSRNGFHSCQNQQPSSSNGMECLNDVTHMDHQTEEKADADAGAGAEPSTDLIFSPRPCSPSSLDNKSFGDFCHALRME